MKSYAHDDAGRRTAITYPGGTNQATYAYDAANELTSVTDWGGNSISYAYDDAGRLTSKTLPAGTGVVSSYAYDTADRLTGITHVKDGSTTIASVSYTVDAVGNRTQRVDQAGTHTYAYDNLYRLTSVTYPGPTTTSYAFDAFGNRTSLTDSSGTTAYTYDDAERLTAVTPPSPAPVVNYSWDNNGDLTQRGSDTFTWDYEDRMSGATVGGVSTTFGYRGDGLRNSRTTGGTTTTFTWDVNRGLPVVLDDGRQYVYGAGLEAMIASGARYYYLADGLGSTMAVVDSAGAVQKSYTYDVYGKPTATGTLANEFDFAGQQTDPTGLQYLRARYYDNETGRFVSREPMEAVPGWQENSYGYSACSPATLGDPSGLRPTDGTDDRDRSARQKACDDIASKLLRRARQMREDREVIEGRGTGRPVSNDDKKNKQNRWKDYQGAVKELMSRWRRLECAKHVGNGSLPNDIDELEHGEYPKFDSSRWHFPHIELPDLPDPPDVWWDGDPFNPWDLLPQIGRPLGPQTR